MKAWFLHGMLAGMGLGVLMPFWIAYLQSARWIQPIRPQGPAHQSKGQTPSLGGVLMFGVWIGVSYITARVPSGALSGLWGLGLAFFLLGLLDDWMKIHFRDVYAFKAWQKFSGQCFFAILAWLWLWHMGWMNTLLLQEIPGFGKCLMPVWLGLPLWILVIVGTSNAVNLVDGLDGLASGVCVPIIVALMACNTLHATQDFQGALASLLGVLLSFLWFNGYPGTVMMGDSGALFLGAVLGYSAFCMQKIFAFALMSGVLILVTLSVIWQVMYFRYTKGKRWFRMAPLQHHFELLGMPETRIVLRFWLVSCFFSGLGVLLCQSVMI